MKNEEKEAVAWRIVYRMAATGDQIHSEKDIKVAINVDDRLFDEAIDVLTEAQVIRYVGDGEIGNRRFRIVDEDWGGSLMKIFSRPTPSEDVDMRQLMWEAWREGWNRQSSTDSLTDIEERTASGRFDRWFKRNYDFQGKDNE